MTENDMLEVARFLAEGMARPDLIDLFDRFAGGDELVLEEFRPLLDRLDPDLIWDSTELDAPDMAKVYRGPAGVIEYFRIWLAAWDEFGWRTSNFEQHGEDVIYDVHISARSRENHLPLEMHVTHRMTLRDGKLLAWRLFRERQDAFR